MQIKFESSLAGQVDFFRLRRSLAEVVLCVRLHPIMRINNLEYYIFHSLTELKVIKSQFTLNANIHLSPYSYLGRCHINLME